MVFLKMPTHIILPMVVSIYAKSAFDGNVGARFRGRHFSGIVDPKCISLRACWLCEAAFTSNLAVTKLRRLSTESTGISERHLEGYKKTIKIVNYRQLTLPMWWPFSCIDCKACKICVPIWFWQLGPATWRSQILHASGASFAVGATIAVVTYCQSSIVQLWVVVETWPIGAKLTIPSIPHVIGEVSLSHLSIERNLCMRSKVIRCLKTLNKITHDLLHRRIRYEPRLLYWIGKWIGW